MTLSELLISYRKDHGFSQREFAARSGVSNGYISMLEKNINPSTGGPIVPSLTNLNKIAIAMGITIDDMFSIIDDMPVTLSTPLKEKEPAPDRSKLFDEMAAMFNSLTEADQQKALGYLAGLRDKDKS